MAATKRSSRERFLAKLYKRAKYRASRRRRGSAAAGAFMSAALLLPGLALTTSSDAFAQQGPGPAEVRFQWASYRDYQSGSVRDGEGRKGREDRIDIQSPMFWGRMPLGEQTEIEGGLVVDSVSGASPFYLDALSGASGSGIEDRRTAGDFKVTRYFERFSAGVGYARSIEDDYRSHSGIAELKWWTEDKNTTLAASYAFDSDGITCTNNPLIDESRRTGHYLIGVTQVIDPISIVQSNLAFEHADGFLSDPYKLSDLRPSTRDSFAWLIRYNRYLDSLNGSLHLDYRLGNDSFGVTSHTFEAALYKPLGEGWMIRPRLRYYSQRKADFYSSTFPPESPGEQFYSADGRLGSFGGVTIGLKIERELGNGFSVNVAGDYLEQRAGWVLGGNGSAAVRRFYAPFFSVGITKSF